MPAASELLNFNFSQISHFSHDRLTQLFSSISQRIPAPPVRESNDYVLGNTGKHLRPMLIYAAGRCFQAPLENCDAPAAAIEMIHTYSLIHDDLPCMDNADLRRGKPTCHKLFGEGMAVLTGDALQTLAIEFLIQHPCQLSAERRLAMMSVLSRASGAQGMAAGQALDITLLSDASLTLELLELIYQLKTGALFTASLELGWLASSDQDQSHLSALLEFGNALGLAFQIQDDLLDMRASTQTLGKPQGIDNINNKMTYPRLAGQTAAEEKVNTLYETALDAINLFGKEAALLRQLANDMLKRQY
jgi:geranylgeranyl pyrophosphate synthase